MVGKAALNPMDMKNWGEFLLGAFLGFVLGMASTWALAYFGIVDLF